MQSFILSKDALNKILQYLQNTPIRPSLAWVQVNIDDEKDNLLVLTHIDYTKYSDESWKESFQTIRISLILQPILLRSIATVCHAW